MTLSSDLHLEALRYKGHSSQASVMMCAILTAATGDTTKSPGHRVTKVFKTAQNGHRVNKNLLHAFNNYVRSLQSQAILNFDHGVTAKFRRRQIVSPAAVSIAPM